MEYSQIISYWTTLCLSCAPNVNPVTTTAIIKIESNGNSLAIGDNTTHKSYSPKNKADAIRIAENLLNQKHSIDIGLMQINSTHIKSMRLNLYNLFDPCYNVSVGSRILTDFYIKHSKTSSNSQETLLKAISSYNTGHPSKGFYNGYVRKMLNSVNYAFMAAPPINKTAYNNINNTPTPLAIESNNETLQDSTELENNETIIEAPKQEQTSFFVKKHTNHDVKK